MMALATERANRVEVPAKQADRLTGGVRESKVSRAILNFWLDAALFVVVAFVMWVSVMIQVVFPRPTAAEGWRLWGLSFNQWHDAQFYGLCIAALLVVEHIVLHWNWVCSIIATRVLRTRARADEGVQALYGVGTFIGILILMMVGIMAAMCMVRRPPL
jgi:hypothetical protein